MKIASKMLLFVMIAAMFLGLLTGLKSNTDAAETPVLVLSSTTAANPILDHLLDYETFGSGGGASTMPPHNACLHNYIGGICMNCFELDPDYRHPCLNGHDFNETGACKNCSIYDPHFFARCTDGHDLDENGQCRNCRYFEEILRPEPTPNDAHPNHDEDSNSTLLIVLIVIISLLLVGITVVIILLLRKKK
jgi:hypothetical protein